MEEAIRVVVVDDSVSQRSRRGNRSAVAESSLALIEYDDGDVQREFLTNVTRKLGDKSPGPAAFTRELGRREWDLGAVRNYAAMRVIAIGAGVAVFLDDDVAVEPLWARRSRTSGSIGVLCTTVLKSPRTIAGARLKGAVDASSLERYLSTLRSWRGGTFALPERPVAVSGGFMACSPRWLRRRPFPRVYNEDWIWLLMSRSDGAVIRCTRAVGTHRSIAVGFPSWRDIAREMRGEVLCEGWWAAEEHAPEHARLLLKSTFWEEVKAAESQYILSLIRHLLQTKRSGKESGDEARRAISLLRRIETFVKDMSAAELVDDVRGHLRDERVWRMVTECISEGMAVGGRRA